MNCLRFEGRWVKVKVATKSDVKVLDPISPERLDISLCMYIWFYVCMYMYCMHGCIFVSYCISIHSAFMAASLFQ